MCVGLLTSREYGPLATRRKREVEARDMPIELWRKSTSLPAEVTHIYAGAYLYFLSVQRSSNVAKWIEGDEGTCPTCKLTEWMGDHRPRWSHTAIWHILQMRSWLYEAGKLGYGKNTRQHTNKANTTTTTNNNNNNNKTSVVKALCY
jgi:hypothetical protein